jgi:Family of unknown function (DUF5654)
VSDTNVGPQGEGRRAKSEAEERREIEQLLEVAKRASRFSREFLVTVISVVTTAFGVVVALAWNTALSTALSRLSKGAQIAGLFIYAMLITLLAVLVIVFLGRLAQRIGAEPIQFALPKKEGPPRTSPCRARTTRSSSRRPPS